MRETVHEIRLSLALGPGAPFRKLFEKFGSARGIFEAGDGAFSDLGLSAGQIRRLEDRSLTEASRIAEYCEKNCIGILTYGSAGYPAKLAGISNPPYLLYVSGKLPALDGRLSLGIVGTREMTGYGMRTAYRTAYEAASAGAVIISGMARGIDGFAAAGAIEAGGATVAVTGCGLDSAYPREHEKLMRLIAENGAVISEYPPSSPPLAGHFPVRNRIISGLSDGVFVVEAALKSGAMLTADIAKNQGRKIFALPGRTEDRQSSGPNLLIRNGALPVLGTEDILSEYSGEYPSTLSAESFARSTVSSHCEDRIPSAYGLASAGDCGRPAEAVRESSQAKSSPPAAPQPKKRLPPDGELREFYLLIPRGEKVSADFFLPLGYSAQSAMRMLTMLEISGFVTGIPGGMYVL